MSRTQLKDTRVAPVSKGLLKHFRLEHLYAGLSGGAIATFTLHPLDLIKIRFQVNEGLLTKNPTGSVPVRPQYKGYFDAVKTIFQTEGVTGLYQGVKPNVVGSATSWGLYFFFYQTFKNYLQDGDSTVDLGMGNHTLAAFGSGLLTLLFTNPIWVIKTRMCLQYEGISGTAKTHSDKNYRGMTNAFIKIYQQEGVKGWYRGFLPGVFGISHGVIQFVIYEEMKTRYNMKKNRPIDSRLRTSEYLTFAALSKTIAATLTYPYQVVRSRLQDQHRSYKSIGDVMKQIYRFEGLRGFYKGSVAYLVHVTPNICIVFLIMEKLTNPSH